VVGFPAGSGGMCEVEPVGWACCVDVVDVGCAGCARFDPDLEDRKASKCCSSESRLYFRWRARCRDLNVVALRRSGGMAPGKIQ
jgi:hypothetical protein